MLTMERPQGSCAPPRLIIIDPHQQDHHNKSLAPTNSSSMARVSTTHAARRHNTRTGAGAGTTTATSHSDNDSSTLGNGPKTGRKGDARMHRAVAARLADSSLSLFEALQVGGFEYSVDDDANSVDQEGVTLGQRKNQLSRRLRQARKHPHPDMEEFMKSERNRKRPQSQCALLDEELDDCRRKLTKQQHLPEPEQAFLAKNHADYGHSVIAYQQSGPKQAGVPNPVQYNNNSNRSVASNGSNGFPKVPSQVHVQHHHTPMYSCGLSAASQEPPSGVAIATFKSISQSLGMTVEQLALALSSSDNLLKVLTTDEKEKRRKQQELACNLYNNEIQALIQRCMLLAGYTIERTQEGTPCNLEFSVLAWQQEGERLKAIYNQKYINEPPIQATIDQVLSATRGERPSDGSSSTKKKQAEGTTSNTAKTLSSPRQQQPEFIQVQIDARAVREHHDCTMDGRHLHLLEGKCGHKAVLHQPANGNAHIDFVVGNKIECYAHVPPIGNAGTHNISVWPSQYTCQGDDVKSMASSQQSVAHGGDAQHPNDDASTVNTPRILDLDDVDFSGQEWNAEFTNDESLLGLFKLSDGRSLAPSDCHSLMGASTTSSLHDTRPQEE